MSVSDPIADFLTIIRNGLMAKHRFVEVHWSKIKEALTQILKEEGLIEGFLLKKEGTIGTLRIYLKYAKGRNPVIQGLKRVSRPGMRKYVTCEEIPDFFGGLGVSILSTSQGIMVGKKARECHIGGELVCFVW